MLEIILIVFLYRKMGRILTAKGHPPRRFQILVPVIWFGGEILGAIVFALFNPEIATEGVGLIGYLFAFLVAVGGTGALFIVAHGLPPLEPGADRDLRDFRS